MSIPLRLRRDLADLRNDPPAGIITACDEQDIQCLHVLIVGPEGTPYEGGFFYFLVNCPDAYPFKPPTVKLMTTDGGKVRFNPNLYSCGRVCLSILGTFPGPSWSPAQNLASCLVTVQSLMNNTPYHNEPGFEKEMKTGDAVHYREMIRHETLRVAVCGMMENETKLQLPQVLQDFMATRFQEKYAFYEEVAKREMARDGTSFLDMYRVQKGKFHYKKILKRLQKLAEGK